MAYYGEDLESHAVCRAPRCRETHHTNEIYFHGMCHIDSPTWARYRGDVLTVECAECRKRIASFVVASRYHDFP